MRNIALLCIAVLGCTAQSNDFSKASEWLNQNLNLDNRAQPQTDSGEKTTEKPTLNPTAPQNACVTSDMQIGKCVKQSECDEEMDEVDLTKIDVYRKGSCHYLLKCCPLDQLRETPKPTEAPPPTKLECGWGNPGASIFRKKSSENADFGEFPWMVALIKKTASEKLSKADYLGGGSLIHPTVVVTAAHKVHKFSANDFKTRIGEWDTQTTNEAYPYQERNVKKIIVHPDFVDKRSTYNVALLLLDAPVNMTNAPHIGLACLGKELPPTGTLCYSMGWGQQIFDSNEYAVWLKKVPLPLVERDQCQYSLRNTVLGTRYRLHNSMVCAGGEQGVDVCKGDGGSPLVCDIASIEDADPRHAVYGLVSFGIGCGKNNVPGVYTNIPYVYDWIVDTLAQEGISSESFTA